MVMVKRTTCIALSTVSYGPESFAKFGNVPLVVKAMKQANRLEEMLTSRLSGNIGAVLPPLDAWPDTYLNTLGKALAQGVLLDDCTVLVVDSIQLKFRGSTFVIGLESLKSLCQFSGGCVALELMPKEIAFTGHEPDQMTKSS